MDPATDTPLIPMDAVLIDALVEVALQRTIQRTAEEEARASGSDPAGEKKALYHEWACKLAEDLPVNLAVSLTDRQLVRASQIKHQAEHCLDTAKDHREVAHSFQHIFEPTAARVMLKLARSSEWSDDRDRRRSLFESVRQDVLGGFRGQEPAEKHDPLAGLESTIGRRAAAAYEEMAIRAPHAWQVLVSLRERNPFLAGFALGAFRSPRGRPGGPTPHVATRVWTVDTLWALCSLTIRQSLELWSTWFPDHALDDVHQFRKEKKAVAEHLRRLEHLGVWQFPPEIEEGVDRVAQAWQADQEP